MFEFTFKNACSKVKEIIGLALEIVGFEVLKSLDWKWKVIYSEVKKWLQWSYKIAAFWLKKCWIKVLQCCIEVETSFNKGWKMIEFKWIKMVGLTLNT